MAENTGQGLVNYETGDTSQWTSSTIDAGNSFTATEGSVLHGTYGGLVEFGGSSNNALFYKTPSGGNQAKLCIRKYINLNTVVAPASIGYIQPLRITQGTTTLAQANFKVETNGDVKIYSLQYQNGSGLTTVTTGGSLTFSVDTDYYIELLWDYNSGSNEATIKIDGTTYRTATGISQTTYQYADRGYGGWTHGSGGKFGDGSIIFEDDFKMDTDWIGVYSDSSLNISSVSDTTINDTQSGIVITGTNFSASGNTVHLNTASNGSGTDVEQTITGESSSEITFTADYGAISSSIGYIAVENATAVYSNWVQVTLVDNSTGGFLNRNYLWRQEK